MINITLYAITVLAFVCAFGFRTDYLEKMSKRCRTDK